MRIYLINIVRFLWTFACPPISQSLEELGNPVTGTDFNGGKSGNGVTVTDFLV
jgi:hypothetical protein